jgi:hypothetical protein
MFIEEKTVEGNTKKALFWLLLTIAFFFVFAYMHDYIMPYYWSDPCHRVLTDFGASLFGCK